MAANAINITMIVMAISISIRVKPRGEGIEWIVDSGLVDEWMSGLVGSRGLAGFSGLTVCGLPPSALYQPVPRLPAAGQAG